MKEIQQARIKKKTQKKSFLLHRTYKNRQQATHGPQCVNSYSVEQEGGKTIHLHFVKKLATSCSNIRHHPFIWQVLNVNENLAVCLRRHFLIRGTP